MGEPLLCPKCDEGTMKWADPDCDDLFEKGIMVCCKCGAQYKGIPGWEAAFEFMAKV